MVAVGVPIADTDLNLLQAVQNVQLGQAKPGDAVDLHGIAQGDRIEPATASRPPGGRAKFMPLGGQVLAHLIKQFGGERARADSRRVRFGDA